MTEDQLEQETLGWLAGLDCMALLCFFNAWVWLVFFEKRVWLNISGVLRG